MYGKVQTQFLQPSAPPSCVELCVPKSLGYMLTVGNFHCVHVLWFKNRKDVFHSDAVQQAAVLWTFFLFPQRDAGRSKTESVGLFRHFCNSSEFNSTLFERKVRTELKVFQWWIFPKCLHFHGPCTWSHPDHKQWKKWWHCIKTMEKLRQWFFKKSQMSIMS